MGHPTNTRDTVAVPFRAWPCECHTWRSKGCNQPRDATTTSKPDQQKKLRPAAVAFANDGIKTTTLFLMFEYTNTKVDII